MLVLVVCCSLWLAVSTFVVAACRLAAGPDRFSCRGGRGAAWEQQAEGGWEETGYADAGEEVTDRWEAGERILYRADAGARRHCEARVHERLADLRSQPWLGRARGVRERHA